MSHSHRPTLKQSNKPFKGHGMNQKNAPKAKSQVVAALGKDLSKEDRVNMAKQLREGKSVEAIQKKLLGALQPPKTVALVSFNASADTTFVKRMMIRQLQGDDAAAALIPNSATTILLPNWAQPSSQKDVKKQRMTFIDVPRNFEAALDVVKIADIVVCVYGFASLESPAFDEEGYRLLSALQLQGLPTLMGVTMPASQLGLTNPKAVKESVSFAERYFISEFGQDKKFHQLETEVDVKNTIRQLSGLTPKQVGFRMNRGYMMAHAFHFDQATEKLTVTGYARGVGFSCRHPVHLTGVGDAILTRVEVATDPCPIGRTNLVNQADTEMDGSAAPASGEKAGAYVLDELREDMLDSVEEAWRNLLPFNPLEGEQTYLSGKVGLSRADAGDEDDGMGAAEADVLLADSRAAGARLNQKTSTASRTQMEVVGADKEKFTGELDIDIDGNMKEDVYDDDEDEAVDDDELLKDILNEKGEVEDGLMGDEAAMAEKRRLQMTIRAQEEMQFPDEKDTPLDMPARERFKKYRGLGAFKTSAWDPYLDLPASYQRIFEFEAFRATAKASIKDFIADCEAVDASGRYVTLTLEGISYERFVQANLVSPPIISTLLSIERKVTVQQFRFMRVLPFDEPIKSKDPVEIHCGFRRLPARPLYSTVPLKTVGSFETKSRFQKFLNLDGAEHFAHVLAPAVVAPCSALLFKKDLAGMSKHLAAWGSVEQPDPTSVCLKRILLTGYPFRVHKKKVVTRFMFFNAADVKWFKPVQVHTKKGTLGHVIESVGTHGYMKCRFAGKVSQADTVCMPLFKRVYPVWYPPAWGGKDEQVEEAPVARTVAEIVKDIKPAVHTGDTWE